MPTLARETFQKLYSLLITPGGRDGGQDNHIVEVFFGNRALDRSEQFTFENGELQRRVVINAESGATLQYYRQDNDWVVVFLYPARVRNAQALRGGVILEVIKNPKVLARKRKLKRHWRYLMATMECTSIDGTPTWMDRMLWRWLRITRYEVKDNTAERGRIWGWLGVLAAFIFMVGFAGWALDSIKALWSILFAGVTVVDIKNYIHNAMAGLLSLVPGGTAWINIPNRMGLLSAILGFSGTIFLFFGAYGLQHLEGGDLGSPEPQERNAEIKAKNKRRKINQTIGLGLLCCSFAVQALALLLS